MSEWSVQDWSVFVATVIVPLFAAVATLWAAITKNTNVTKANTEDRAVKTAATTEVLGTIATQVNDIHAGSGTGSGVTVNVPPPAPPTP